MKKIQEAIIKTLVYSDIFEYPLKKEEIWRYLVEEEIEITDLEKELKELMLGKKLGEKEGYYFLFGREDICKMRQKRADISRKKMNKAQRWTKWLKLNPFLLMVGISGTLAVENAEEDDDIDLVLVFAKDRLYLGRLLEYLILKLMGKRRNPGQVEVKDLLCPNLYLTEDHLKMGDHDLFTAHEIVQVRLLWDKRETYSRFLNDNQWVNKFLPNVNLGGGTREEIREGVRLLDKLERWAKKLQYKHMEKKISRERITEGALFFHPRDMRTEVLARYHRRLREVF